MILRMCVQRESSISGNEYLRLRRAGGEVARLSKHNWQLAKRVVLRAPRSTMAREVVGPLEVTNCLVRLFMRAEPRAQSRVTSTYASGGIVARWQG